MPQLSELEKATMIENALFIEDIPHFYKCSRCNFKSNQRIDVINHQLQNPDHIFNGNPHTFIPAWVQNADEIIADLNRREKK